MRGGWGRRRCGKLTLAVLAWRSAHGVIAAGFLGSIGYVWWCAITGRRDPLLALSVSALVGEGVLVVGNHGDCPLGPVGDRIGDPVPLFELVLPPRAARLAVPALGGIAGLGLGLLVLRSRRAVGSNAAPPPAAAAARPSRSGDEPGRPSRC